METKNLLGNIAKIVLPFVLGGAILWWMYRDEDLSVISHVLTEEMDWTWMLLSFPFGILAQMFRGWRWKQTLEPISRRDSRSVECGVRSENTSAAEIRQHGDSFEESRVDGDLTPHSTLHTPHSSLHKQYSTSIRRKRRRCLCLFRFQDCPRGVPR